MEGDPPVGHQLELGIPAARLELFGQAETEALGSWAVSRSPSSLHLSSLRSSFLRYGPFRLCGAQPFLLNFSWDGFQRLDSQK